MTGRVTGLLPERPWRVLALVLAVCGLIALDGARSLGDEPAYPPAESSPYLLPWPAGVARLCVQGNRGVVSHFRGESGEFSYDFGMPTGSTVTAARGGVVRRVVVKHTGRGTNKPNNKIAIDHGDGTTGWYLHLQKDGSLVKVGDRVVQGQPIARSGNVGKSLIPHLHFHVSGQGGATIPITFRDVADKGIPRMFKRYTSSNQLPEDRKESPQEEPRTTPR